MLLLDQQEMQFLWKNLIRDLLGNDLKLQTRI